MVDISLEHKEHLFLHLLTCNVVSCVDIVLVTVHTLHLDRLTVQIIVASCQTEFIILSLSIADFNLAESHICRCSLKHLALLVEQRYNQCIAVRLLGTPLCRVSYRHVKFQGLCIAGEQLLKRHCHSSTLNNLVLIAVESILIELNLNLVLLDLLCSEITHIDFNVRNGILILCVKVCTDTDIAKFYRIGRCQRYSTEDTRKTEHILCLKERTVAVSVNLYSYHIFTLDKILCDIERRKVTRVLREAHILAVYP